MSERPNLTGVKLDDARLNEIRGLLTYESSVSFQSARAHESIWLLVAEIERSSGSKSIDDAVLAAIWRIAFPAPPGGMSERQRSYTAPIEFR